MMYSMKEACIQTGMSYETLKFYCKEGLVPNVKRDSHNYRVFDDRDIKWIQSLGCLKRCGMTLAEMKELPRSLRLPRSNLSDKSRA